MSINFYTQHGLTPLEFEEKQMNASLKRDFQTTKEAIHFWKMALPDVIATYKASLEDIKLKLKTETNPDEIARLKEEEIFIQEKLQTIPDFENLKDLEEQQFEELLQQSRFYKLQLTQEKAKRIGGQLIRASNLTESKRHYLDTSGGYCKVGYWLFGYHCRKDRPRIAYLGKQAEKLHKLGQLLISKSQCVRKAPHLEFPLTEEQKDMLLRYTYLPIKMAQDNTFESIPGVSSLEEALYDESQAESDNEKKAAAINIIRQMAKPFQSVERLRRCKGMVGKSYSGISTEERTEIYNRAMNLLAAQAPSKSRGRCFKVSS